MYSTTFYLLVICATTYIAVANPTGDLSMASQAESTAQSSTRSIQNSGSNEGFSQTKSVSTSTGASASNSQSGDDYHKLFKFVHEQEIRNEQDFDQLLQKLENIVENKYREAFDELKQWNEIEPLAEYEQKAESGLTFAKDQLREIISEAGNNLRSQLKGCNAQSESFRQQIQELRQKFESQIKESLIYFIQALEGIKAVDFKSGDNGPRCLGGKGKRLAARSIGSGIINAGMGMVGKAADTGKEMLNEGIEMGGEMMNSAVDFKTGMGKKATNYGNDMIHRGSSAAGSMAESGVEMGSEMFNSARGIGEGMAERATGFGGQMAGAGSSAMGSMTGQGGRGKGGKCEHGPHGGQGPHGGKGPHGDEGPHQGGSGPQGHGHGQGRGQEGDLNVSSGQASSSASAGSVQEFENDGDDYYSSTSSSARSFAGAESGVESKSLSV